MQTCLEYNINYVPGPKIGSGMSGHVYLTNKGDYVMKIVPLKDSPDFVPWCGRRSFVSEAEFLNEIDMQNKFASWGLAVPVEDYWICKNYGAMAMRRLEITLENFVPEHPGNEKTIRDAVEKVSKIHFNQNASHGDYTDQNIMLDTHNYNNSAVSINVDDKVYYLYLIDFGLAGENQKFDRDNDVGLLEIMLDELFI